MLLGPSLKGLIQAAIPICPELSCDRKHKHGESDPDYRWIVGLQGFHS